MSPGVLRVHEEAGGGWSLTLSCDETSPERATVPADAVCAVLAAASSIQRAPRAVLGGDDPERGQAELAFGALLGQVAFGSPALARALGRLLGAGVPALLVDGAANLPWELLAVGEQTPTFAEDLGLTVVRRAPGPPSSSRVVGGAAAVWQLGRDPVCRQLADELGFPCAARLEDLPDAGLLLVGAHGDVDRLHRNRGALGSSGLAASLQGYPAGLVVLLACDSGTAEGLAALVIAAGVPAVLAPAARVPLEVARAAGAAAAANFAQGPLAAARASRRAVRALATPLPAGRWWQWRLTVASHASLQTQVVQLPGWPNPSAEGTALVREIGAAGTRLGLVGLEALIEALGGPISHRLLPSLCARLGHLVPGAGANSPPRMSRLGAALPSGFGNDDVRHALQSELPNWFESWDGTRTWRSGPQQAGPARGLEVMGGPDDGRQLFPSPAQTIGRHDVDDGPDLAMYRDTALVDPRLSRRHLAWLGSGRLRLLRSAARLMGGERVGLQPGDIELEIGGLLELAPGTLVRGIA
jgi:hypothetical protein